MRVVSWNIRAGGGTRVDGIAAQLARWRADVVAFCEFRATPGSAELARRLAAQGLVHQRTTADPRRPRDNALLIAARWPLRRVRISAEPLEPRRWLLVRVNAPRPFQLGAMHIPNRVTGRKWPFFDAVLAVVGDWRRGPAVLVGDTNSGYPLIDEETAAFNAREEGWLTALDGFGWADGFRLLRPRARAFTWYSPNGGNGFRIDQAFINRTLAPHLLGARYAWGRTTRDAARASLSDHAALLVDFDLAQRPRSRATIGAKDSRAASGTM